MAARRTIDYSQQLDLFGGLGVDSWTEATEEAANVREKPARTDDPRTLAEAPTENGRGVANNEPVGPDDLRSAGDDRGPAVRTGVGPENGLPGSLGDRHGRVDSTAEPGSLGRWRWAGGLSCRARFPRGLPWRGRGGAASQTVPRLPNNRSERDR